MLDLLDVTDGVALTVICDASVEGVHDEDPSCEDESA